MLTAVAKSLLLCRGWSSKIGCLSIWIETKPSSGCDKKNYKDDDILGDEDQPLLKKVKSRVIVEPLVEEDEQKVKLVPALILGNDESSPVDEIDGTEGKFNPL